MRTGVVIVIVAVLIVGALLEVHAADVSRPVVLVFEAARGEGVDSELTASATRALRNYLRETGRVESIIFDRESPTELRAIMEEMLTADMVASYSSRAERLRVAKALSYDYAAGAEVTARGDNVTVKLWVGKVDGGKRGSWEATGSATAGGTGELDRENAMQSAASTAVREIERQAFASLPRAVTTGAATSNGSTAIAVPDEVKAAQPTAEGYASKAEKSLQEGNVALAIGYYSQAVSADPANAALRIKLADAYARKGLFSEALDELGRATMIGADAELVASARQRIERMKSGETVEPTPGPPGDSAIDKPPEPSGSRPINDAMAPSIAKMVEGDRLWKQGKTDEAAEAYVESIKLNPSDWRAHERLAVICASMSLFTRSREALQQLNVVQPDPSTETISRRYDVFRKAFDEHLAALLRQYDTQLSDFEKRSITRETYYNGTRGLAARLEAMAKFLDALPLPPAKEPANLRRSLACGLVAQAASSLLDYLETNSEEANLNAAVFAAQAKREVEAAVRLEANKIVVER